MCNLVPAVLTYTKLIHVYTYEMGAAGLTKGVWIISFALLCTRARHSSQPADTFSWESQLLRFLLFPFAHCRWYFSIELSYLYLPRYLFPLPLYFSIFFYFPRGRRSSPNQWFYFGGKSVCEQPFCINEMFAFPFCTLAITFKKNIYCSLFNSNSHVFHFPVFKCLRMVLIVIINW